MFVWPQEVKGGGVTVEVAASGVSMGQAHFDICTQVTTMPDRDIRYKDMMDDRGDKKEDSERGHQRE